MPNQEEMERIRRRASMDYWYPRLAEVDGINIPKTYRVDIRRFEEAMELTEGVPMPDPEEVEKGVRAVDGPPAFIRSDQASYKHKMDACKVKRGDDLQDVYDTVFETLNHNNLLSFTGLPFTSVYVREWLDLDHPFKAFSDTPIGAEVRYFIRDGERVGHGFYWPADALKEHQRHDPELPDDWESRHENFRDITLRRARNYGCHRMADKVAEKFDGFWSVDFAVTSMGTWYCIDMAPGKASWQPDEVNLDG